MNSDGWDDSIIINAFDSAITSHLKKRKGEKSNNNNNNNNSSSSSIRIGEPQPWIPVSSSNYTSVNYNTTGSTYTSNTNTNTNYMNIPNTPIIDEALQEMLAAWYQSGYATGRYHALKEIQQMRESNNNNI